MKRAANGIIVILVFGVAAIAVRGDEGDSRVRRGFEISPVRVNVNHNNRELVGLGSYLVNAVGGCNDCHTCPSYSVNPFAPGHGHGAVNADNYLAGGVAFQTPAGTFVSANLTPDPSQRNLPDGGHTFAQFKSMMRTGHDADPPHDILQVMPWPVFGNMTDDDLRAVYEYLQAIPHAVPGTEFGPTCPAPGMSKP
jgi:hypothetical protein